MPIRADCSFFLREYRRILTNDIEKHYLQRLMLATGGDMAKACALAGVSRFRLYDRLKHHALTNTTEYCPK